MVQLLPVKSLISAKRIRESLAIFQELNKVKPYYVCGINFINDSKATNVNSTWYAINVWKTMYGLSVDKQMTIQNYFRGQEEGQGDCLSGKDNKKNC